MNTRSFQSLAACYSDPGGTSTRKAALSLHHSGWGAAAATTATAGVVAAAAAAAAAAEGKDGKEEEEEDEGSVLTNWSGTHSSRPGQCYFPETSQEVEQVVMRHHRNGTKLRVKKAPQSVSQMS
jgi:hypothetical protein